MNRRFKIIIDGKWQGGSFGSQKEAEQAAAAVRKRADQKIEIVPKGIGHSAPAPDPDLKPEPKQAEPEPEAAPAPRASSSSRK